MPAETQKTLKVEENQQTLLTHQTLNRSLSEALPAAREGGGSSVCRGGD